MKKYETDDDFPILINDEEEEYRMSPTEEFICNVIAWIVVLALFGSLLYILWWGLSLLRGGQF